MANNDWDLDDLLNFNYDREVPEKKSDFDILDQFDRMPEPEKPKSGKGLGNFAQPLFKGCSGSAVVWTAHRGPAYPPYRESLGGIIQSYSKYQWVRISVFAVNP